MSDLDKINSIFNAKIDSVKTKEDLQNIKTDFFGKNGQITQQFKSLGSLDPEKKIIINVKIIFLIFIKIQIIKLIKKV